MLVMLSLFYLFVLLPLGVMWSGYALSKLWAWFLVPALGLPELSIPAAIGLAMVVSYMTYQPTNTNKDKDANQQILEVLLSLALKPTLAIGFGWVVARWM